MRLHNLKRSLANHYALIPWATVCYAVLFGVLVYSLAVEARLDAWREASAQATATQQRVTFKEAASTVCAELAGMGQRLCNADARIDAARTRFQQRAEARFEHAAAKPVAGVKRLWDRPARARIDHAEPGLVDLPAQAPVPRANDAPAPADSRIAAATETAQPLVAAAAQ